MGTNRGRWGLALAAVICLLLADPAVPSGLRCRSAPTLVLTDGAVLDLSADIDGMLWDVTSVTYTVHVPKGVKAILVIRTPNWPTAVEKFLVVSDLDTRTYAGETVATTRQGGTATATMLVTSVLRTG